MPTKALCGLAVRALAQPAALNEPMGLGLQPCGLSTASPSVRCGTPDNLQGRGSPRTLSLISFAVLPDGSFQEASQ